MRKDSKMSAPFWSVLFSAVLAVCFTGCGGEPLPEGLPSLVPCQVKVTQGAEPLTEASVTLIPVSGDKWSGTGRTDASGVAVIYTWDKHKGAPLGKYKVIVSKTESDKVQAVSSDNPAPPPIKSYNLVEDVYQGDATPLAIEVVKGTKEYAVDAGKKVRNEIPAR